MSEAAGLHAAAIARRLRLIVLSAVMALIATVAGWLLSDGVSFGRITLVAVATLPLWLAVPRLRAGDRRTYAWMTLAVIPYFVFAITEAVASPQERVWAGLCLFVGLALFVMLIGYLRVTREVTG